MSSLRIKLAAFIVLLCSIGFFAATAASASAAPATVFQQSCSINGVSGTGQAVFLGNGMLALTSCHTPSKSSPALVIKSGTCTTLGDQMNVCAGFKP